MQSSPMLSTDLLVSPANLVRPVPLLDSKLHRALTGWRDILASLTSLPDHAPKRIKGRARTKRAVSRASRDAVSLGSSWLGLETQIGALFLKHLSPSSVCFKVEGTMGFLAKPTAQLCSLLLSQESCVPELPCDTVCSAWNSWGGTEV